MVEEAGRFDIVAVNMHSVHCDCEECDKWWADQDRLDDWDLT